MATMGHSNSTFSSTKRCLDMIKIPEELHLEVYKNGKGLPHLRIHHWWSNNSFQLLRAIKRVIQ